ncbi:hypothetical protein D3C78_1501650 [compost metagenome]
MAKAQAAYCLYLEGSSDGKPIKAYMTRIGNSRPNFIRSAFLAGNIGWMYSSRIT